MTARALPSTSRPCGTTPLRLSHTRHADTPAPSTGDAATARRPRPHRQEGRMSWLEDAACRGRTAWFYPEPASAPTAPTTAPPSPSAPDAQSATNASTTPRHRRHPRRPSAATPRRARLGQRTRRFRARTCERCEAVYMASPHAANRSTATGAPGRAGRGEAPLRRPTLRAGGVVTPPPPKCDKCSRWSTPARTPASAGPPAPALTGRPARKSPRREAGQPHMSTPAARTAYLQATLRLHDAQLRSSLTRRDADATARQGQRRQHGRS